MAVSTQQQGEVQQQTNAGVHRGPGDQPEVCSCRTRASLLACDAPEGVVSTTEIVDRYVTGTRLRLREVRHDDGTVIRKLGQKVRLSQGPAEVASHPFTSMKLNGSCCVSYRPCYSERRATWCAGMAWWWLWTNTRTARSSPRSMTAISPRSSSRGGWTLLQM